MILAAVDHGAVVGGEDIVEECGIVVRDGFAGAALDRPELEAALRYTPGDEDAMKLIGECR